MAAASSETGRGWAGAPIAWGWSRAANARSKRTRPLCGALPSARASAGTSKRTSTAMRRSRWSLRPA